MDMKTKDRVINKITIRKIVAEHYDADPNVYNMIKYILNIVKQELLKGNPVGLDEFGVFSLKDCKVKSPIMNTPVEYKRVMFKPTLKFKNIMNNKE